MTRRGALLSVIAVLLGSAVLGVVRMRELSFWYDEVASIDFTNDLIGTLRRFPDQMPAYFVMLRGWLSLVGQSEVAGRWLSLLFGLLALALTYRLARRYASPRAALLTLIVLASSAVFVRYYREMRTYTFLACLGTASMWFYLEWLHRATPGRRRDGLAYVAVTGIMLYTHFFAGLLLAAQSLYTLLAMRRMGRRLWIALGLHAVTGALLLPYLGFYFSGLNWVTSGGRHPAALTTAQGIDSLTRALTNDSLALFAVLALLALATRHRRMLTLALLWLGVPILALFAVHILVIPVFVNPRYLLFVWPAMAVVMALGVETLDARGRWIAAGVLAAIGTGQVINNLPAALPGVLTDQPWREMFMTIGDEARPGDLVLTNMIDPVGLTGFREPLAYYFRRYAPAGMAAPVELDVPPYPTDLPQRLEKSTGTWLLITDGEPNERGQEAIRALRRAGYAECRTWEYTHKTSLAEWQRVAGPFYDFGQTIEVQRAPLNAAAEKYRPGDPIELALGFRAERQPPINYSVGLYVFDARGQVVNQQDGPPANQQTATWQPGQTFCGTYRFVAPTTPGRYEVRAAVYDSMSGQRLSVEPGGDELSAVKLFAFQVE